MADVHEGLVSCLTDIEERLGASVKAATGSLEGFAKRKSRILAIQKGSQRHRIPGAQVILREGSLRALWTEKARKADDAKKAAPEGAVKAEALRWENRRLGEAKEKLEGLTRDQQRRIIQLEEALSEMKSNPPRRSNSLSRTESGTSDPGSPSRKVRMASADAPVQGAVEAARAEAAAAGEARKSAVAERDTARQMLQGVKAMLAQSEALRQSADNSQPLKARQLQRDVDRLQAALARSQAEAAADFRELKAAKAERDLALQTLAEVKSAVAASEAARSRTLNELQDAIQREKSTLETKAAELEARCAGYAGALQRAEREAVADKDCIAALRAAVARLHAQAKATKAEREAAERRQLDVAEDRRRRTLKVLREAEQSRSQLLCDKAAAEHDRALALAAKEAAEKQVASLKARLDLPAGSDAQEGPVHTEVSSSSPDLSVHSGSLKAVTPGGQAHQSCMEAATQTDGAQDLLREDNTPQQQDSRALRDNSRGAQEGLQVEAVQSKAVQAEAERLKEELRHSEYRLQQRDQELTELRAELVHLKAAAPAQPPSQGPRDVALESPPETRRGDAAPKGPTTPETALSEGPSRGTDRSTPDTIDAGSERGPSRRRRRPPSLELWSPGSAHPLSAPSSADAPAPRGSAESSASFASARSLSPYAMSVSSSFGRSGYLLSDGDVFEDARSRAGSNASSLDIDAYFDADSEIDAPVSVNGTPTPDRSGALAQMQEKLAAAVARAEELEREHEGAARLAQLHGRAVETQAAALRAAEASLARKRADVLAANKARAAAEAALRQSIASRHADDLRVQQIAGQLERSLAEAHGEKQRLEEANAEQAALIPALQQACKAAEGQVSELQVQLQQVSVQADETSRSLHAAADAARCAEAAAREEVKTLELCNEQLLSEKEWTWDTMQAMEARVDELLRSQAQAAAVPVDAAQRLCIANLEADLSEARSALAQARTEAAALQQECMQLRQIARGRPAVQQKGSPPSPDPVNKWLVKSLSKAGSPLASWRRSNAQHL